MYPSIESRQSRECMRMQFYFLGILQRGSMISGHPPGPLLLTNGIKWIYTPNQRCFRQRCVVVTRDNSNLSSCHSQKVKSNPAQVLVNRFYIFFIIFLSFWWLLKLYRLFKWWYVYIYTLVHSEVSACQPAETELASSSAHSRRDCRDKNCEWGDDGCVMQTTSCCN